MAYGPLAHDWYPSGDSMISVRETVNTLILSLAGFEVTTISSTESEFEFPGLRLDNGSVLKALAHYRESTSRYPGEDSLREALNFTIAAGASIEPRNWKAHYPRDWTRYLNSGTETGSSRGLDAKVQNSHQLFITTHGIWELARGYFDLVT